MKSIKVSEAVLRELKILKDLSGEKSLNGVIFKLIRNWKEKWDIY